MRVSDPLKGKTNKNFPNLLFAECPGCSTGRGGHVELHSIWKQYSKEAMVTEPSGKITEDQGAPHKDSS